MGSIAASEGCLAKWEQIELCCGKIQRLKDELFEAHETIKRKDNRIQTQDTVVTELFAKIEQEKRRRVHITLENENGVKQKMVAPTFFPSELTTDEPGGFKKVKIALDDGRELLQVDDLAR